MINTVEFDLINKCNLKCPLCLRQESKFANLKNDIKFINIDDIKNFLIKHPFIKTIKLIGTTSEPTLYPHFLELCEFAENNNIKVIINTNGNKNDNNFWTKLSTILKYNSEIVFAIDGSTQEIYSKYRVGGKLDKVLNNYNIMKDSECYKGLQFIQFKHNIDDIQNIISLAKDYSFDFIDLIECNDTNDSIINKYKIEPKADIKNNFYDIRKKMQSKIKCGKIDCLSMKESSFFIGYNSLVYPCSNLFEQDLFTQNSISIKYDDILGNVEKMVENRYKNPECFHACSIIGHKLEEPFLKKRIILNGNKNVNKT